MIVFNISDACSVHYHASVGLLLCNVLVKTVLPPGAVLRYLASELGASRHHKFVFRLCSNVYFSMVDMLWNRIPRYTIRVTAVKMLFLISIIMYGYYNLGTRYRQCTSMLFSFEMPKF